jgi:hypothetical protein
MPTRGAAYRVYISPRPAPNMNQAPAEPDGTYYGVQFNGTYAFLDPKILGEDFVYNAVQSLGADGRFEVYEFHVTSP